MISAGAEALFSDRLILGWSLRRRATLEFLLLKMCATLPSSLIYKCKVLIQVM